MIRLRIHQKVQEAISYWLIAVVQLAVICLLLLMVIVVKYYMKQFHACYHISIERGVG